MQSEELSHILVPPENEGIQHALAELDQRVVAWTNAVMAVQERLGVASTWPIQASIGLEMHAVHHAPPDCKIERHPDYKQSEAAEGDLAVPKDGRSSDEIQLDPSPAALPLQKCERRRDGPQDDHAAMEDMVKDLDPDLATAVRVQWRLLNGRVGVEELIRKCEAMALHGPKSGRYSWWKRVTG